MEQFYVIVCHVAKKQNIGMLVRSACAFGAREILVAGSKKHTNYFGSQGTTRHIPIRNFDTLACAVEYARAKDCSICGVEIKSDAVSLLKTPFKRGSNVAFMLGNEGDGLSERQINACDYFVYIPQYGDGTASLNVSVAASIVFHTFAAWAGYQEHLREGQKYVVKSVPIKRGPETEEDFEKQRLRKEKRATQLKVTE